MVLSAFITSNAEWMEVFREKRLPAELRVVNEGLTHDDTSWLLSNKHMLYRAHRYYLTIEASNHNAIPEELRDQGFNHIGDIDELDGLLYGGIESSDKRGALGVWNATDLSFVRYQLVDQMGVPWIAIDKKTRRLYSAIWSEPDRITVYDADSFKVVDYVDAAKGTVLPSEIQGGAFWSKDRDGLYLAANGNCAVYRLDVSHGRSRGEVEFIISDDYKKRLHEYEMEGLTFWKHPEVEGEMHMFGNFMELKKKSIHSFRHTLLAGDEAEMRS